MNRYTLVNENRAAEFIEELEGVLNDKKQELANIENQIKEDFCGKIPKDLKRSLSEWSQIHKNEKWIEIKKEKDRKFNKFNSLCHGYISLPIAIKKFANNIKLIKETQPKEPNEAINDYLGDDKLSFNEALFCSLGLNPGVLLKIDIASLSALKVREEEDKFLLGNLSLTKEFRKLDKAPIFYVTNNNRTVMTNKFTQWLTNKGIIEVISKESPNKNTKPQNEYLTWQCNYNLVIALVALEHNKEKNLNKILQHTNTPFYKSITSKLVPIYKNGTKKPTPKTLKNNIEAHQKLIQKYQK